MEWDNGITSKGMWAHGQYHGHGRKLYSKGGGYEGSWVAGRREGPGISFYEPGLSLGREGVLRWEGPFHEDKAHGEGQAYVAWQQPLASKAGGGGGGGGGGGSGGGGPAPDGQPDSRWAGDTAVKGPTICFEEGVPVDFP
jgi:hypothetical protein